GTAALQCSWTRCTTATTRLSCLVLASAPVLHSALRSLSVPWTWSIPGITPELVVPPPSSWSRMNTITPRIPAPPPMATPPRRGKPLKPPRPRVSWTCEVSSWLSSSKRILDGPLCVSLALPCRQGYPTAPPANLRGGPRVMPHCGHDVEQGAYQGRGHPRPGLQQPRGPRRDGRGRPRRRAAERLPRREGRPSGPVRAGQGRRLRARTEPGRPGRPPGAQDPGRGGRCQRGQARPRPRGHAG